jgi:iron complex outermembrane receptor protein
MNNFNKTALCLTLSATCGVVAAAGAPLAIEEVTVTAERRSASLQSVPLSVSAFSKDSLQTLQATTLGDIQNAVPNLTLHDGDASNAVVYLRGVGQIDSLSFADPGVGIYLDDVYLGRAQGAFLDVLDVERIEVLRGPQGTLYGRNTIGGAVKYVSTPASEEFYTELEASFGNYQRRDLRATINGSLIENHLFGKFSVASLDREGYSDNLFDSSDDGDKDTIAWRGDLLWQINERLQLDVALDRSSGDSDTSRTPVRETAVFGIPANTDVRRVDANFNDRNELEVEGFSMRARWDLNDQWQFKSISSVRSMDYRTHLDLDATSLALFGVFVDQEQEQWSQEFQLSFDNDSTRVVAGLYAFHEEDDTESGIFGPDLAFVTNSLNRQENDSLALYGQLNQQLGESLTLIAGIRYTREDKDFSRQQEFFDPATAYPPRLGQGLLITDVRAHDTWSEVSPRLGLQYQLNADVMVFFNASQGFKSGGFDGRSQTPFQATPYQPEILTAFEAGIKSQWLQQRLRFNAAVFVNDYKDLQLSSFIADDGGSFAALFTNAGEAKIQGLEIELTGLVTENLSVDVNLGYMDAGYKEYIGPNGTDISAQRHLVNTPEWTARLAPRYTLPLGDLGDLTFSLDVSYRDKTYTTVSSSEVLAQDGYSLVNAGISLEAPDQRWRIALGGKNLTDKAYLAHGFDLSDSLGYQLGYYGAPRTYSLTASYRY